MIDASLASLQTLGPKCTVSPVISQANYGHQRLPINPGVHVTLHLTPMRPNLAAQSLKRSEHSA